MSAEWHEKKADAMVECEHAHMIAGPAKTRVLQLLQGSGGDCRGRLCSKLLTPDSNVRLMQMFPVHDEENLS